MAFAVAFARPSFEGEVSFSSKENGGTFDEAETSSSFGFFDVLASDDALLGERTSLGPARALSGVDAVCSAPFDTASLAEAFLGTAGPEAAEAAASAAALGLKKDAIDDSALQVQVSLYSFLI